MPTFVIVGLAVFVVVWAIFTFNLLIRRRNRVDEAWAQIEVELARRYDLVPNLVEAVRGYAGHEETIFTRVADARSAAVSAPGAAEHDRADTQLTDALRRLFAVSEAYPDLKASEQFQSLQDALVHTEDRIAYARGYYNALVVEYESARLTLPSKLIASALSFPRRSSFEADVTSRANVSVALTGDEPASRS
ncbi:MAG: LemA family protein [Dehalococcoidia bacterium]